MPSPSTRIYVAITTTLLVALPAIAHPNHDAPISILSDRPLSPSVIASGLGMAFCFGAGHALSPGHGKSMVAAYLIGSRSTPHHAILLGLVTTITHTIGVFALGLSTLLISHYILPETLHSILSIASGLLVMGTGGWLLRQRLNQLDHHHNHDQWHTHHHHLQGLHHHHHNHTVITPKSLLTLGIAGGMVPCPSALVLLLSAISLRQTVYGMALVSVFSLELAAVLIGIGLTTVYAKHQLNVFALPKTQFLRQYLPIFSAVFVIWVGFALSILAFFPVPIPI
jgi:nickel/cobalt transporter (NicO) family protein